jgi:hypothetical protein
MQSAMHTVPGRQPAEESTHWRILAVPLKPDGAWRAKNQCPSGSCGLGFPKDVMTTCAGKVPSGVAAFTGRREMLLLRFMICKGLLHALQGRNPQAHTYLSILPVTHLATNDCFLQSQHTEDTSAVAKSCSCQWSTLAQCQARLWQLQTPQARL